MVGSSLLFGAIHVFVGGVSGAIGALLSGLTYARMRLSYDDLSEASLAHSLNNAYWTAVILGVVPDLVAG